MTAMRWAAMHASSSDASNDAQWENEKWENYASDGKTGAAQLLQCWKLNANRPTTMDASTHLFFENLEPNWIDQHLMANFPGLSTTGGWPVSLSGCPLTDIGNYLLRVLHVLATFSESLVMGEVISKHIDERTRELDAENDCHTANLLDDKHEALRCDAYKSVLLDEKTDDNEEASKKNSSVLREVSISDKSMVCRCWDCRGIDEPKLRGYLDMRWRIGAECETVWVLSPPTISAASIASAEIVSPGSHNISPISEEPFIPTMTTEATDYGMYDTAPEGSASASYDHSSSDAWLDESNMLPNNAEEPIAELPSIEQLRARGKGHYTCPRGSECDKGGVQPNGQLTVYERNSAFRYVLVCKMQHRDGLELWSYVEDQAVWCHVFICLENILGFPGYTRWVKR
jgi:hypothetical protein